MARFLFILLIAISAVIPQSSGQFDCTIYPEVRARFNAEAHFAAYQHLWNTGSPDTIEPIIRSTLVDTFLSAFAIIYNAVDLPARDTVIEQLQIRHPMASSYLRKAELYEYKSAERTWVSELLDGIFPTSDTNVNKWLNQFGYEVTGGFQYAGLHVILYAETEQFLNVKAVHRILKDSVGIDLYPDPIIGGGGGGITARFEEDHLLISFGYGWGDCEMGCTHWRRWTFRVDFNPCTLTFLGSSGDNLYTYDVANISNHTHSGVYPNPFTHQLLIEEGLIEQPYILENSLGQKIASGLLPRQLQLDQLIPGMYFLRVQKQNESMSFKLLKQ